MLVEFLAYRRPSITKEARRKRRRRKKKGGRKERRRKKKEKLGSSDFYQVENNLELQFPLPRKA